MFKNVPNRCYNSKNCCLFTTHDLIKHTIWHFFILLNLLKHENAIDCLRHFYLRYKSLDKLVVFKTIITYLCKWQVFQFYESLLFYDSHSDKQLDGLTFLFFFHFIKQKQKCVHILCWMFHIK